MACQSEFHVQAHEPEAWLVPAPVSEPITFPRKNGRLDCHENFSHLFEELMRKRMGTKDAQLGNF